MKSPWRVEAYRPGRALISAESWSNSRVCAGVHSAPVRRSFDKETGATRVFVVILSPYRRKGDALGIRGLAGIRGGGLLWSCCKNEFKEPEKFAHLRAGDEEGRQQAQRKIVGAVDQQTTPHGLADERRAIDGEFDTDHHAFAADFADEAEFRGKLREAVPQLRAAQTNILEELFVLDDLEELEGNGTNQRTAAKRGAMHPGRDARSNVLGGENCAERKAGGERLGNQNDVRFRGKFLIAEDAAGAAESALNFIGDQESAVLRGKRASAIPKYFANRIDSPFALDCFKKDGADGVVEFRLEISDVVETHELRTGNKGRERQAVLFRGGDADGAERTAMKRILKRQEAMLLRGRPRGLVRLASKEPRELEGAIDRFGAAVGEEHAVKPGPSGEFARERALIGIVIEIREVNGAGGFAADYFHDARMRVPERIDGDTAKKIQIFLASGVVDVSAAAVGHHRRLALVSRQKELLGVEQARIGFGPLRSRMFGLAQGTRQGLLLGRGAHHAAERAAWAADKGTRRTRVPGIDATLSLAEASAACDASNKAPGEVPPTMRTSRTPPSMARLAASSLRTMPPETTRHWTKRSISSQVTTERTLSPSRTPATSVR